MRERTWKHFTICWEPSRKTTLTASGLPSVMPLRVLTPTSTRGIRTLRRNFGRSFELTKFFPITTSARHTTTCWTLRTSRAQRQARRRRIAVTTIYQLCDRHDDACRRFVCAPSSDTCCSGTSTTSPLFRRRRPTPPESRQQRWRWPNQREDDVDPNSSTRLARTSDRVDVDGDKKFENLRTIEEPSAPGADASAAGASSAHKDESALPARDFAARDFGPADANTYRKEAISAYRNGDLYLALIKLDVAISRDPKSSDAYIDRSIVFHRLGDTKRAYADIAKAKQIDDLNRR